MNSYAPASADTIAQQFLANSPLMPEVNFVYSEGDDLIYQFNTATGTYTPLTANPDLLSILFSFTTALKDTNVIAPSKNINMTFLRDVLQILKLILPRKLPIFIPSHIAVSPHQALNPLDLSTVPLNRKTIATLSLNLPTPIPPQPLQKAPIFAKFLDDTFKSDPTLIPLLQEVFGYALLPNTKAQTAFFFYGSGANGKSVLLQILRALFPDHLTTSQSLESLTTNRFSLSTLAGKLINIANEEESKYLKSDVFKNLISSEPLTAERKYESSFTFTPNIKLFFATNRLPKFDGVDQAIRRRLILIPFNTYVKPQDRDPSLAARIIASELPYIASWALQGAQRLIQRNYQFDLPTSSLHLLKEFEQEQSSTIEFMEENFNLNATAPLQQDESFPAQKLYEAYREFCKDSGRSPKSRIVFYRELKDRYANDPQTFFTATAKTIKFNNVPVRAFQHLQPLSDPTAWINTYGQLYLQSSPTHNPPPHA